MRFLYGQNGLVGFIIDGITYTYRKNLFGDIIVCFCRISRSIYRKQLDVEWVRRKYD